MEFAHHLNYTANNSFFHSFFHIPGNKNYVMLNDIKIIQKHGEWQLCNQTFYSVGSFLLHFADCLLIEGEWIY